MGLGAWGKVKRERLKEKVIASIQALGSWQ
jgi:hypothetical protein